MAAITQPLGRADGRLVTLTGPGGSGKTRLALEIAATVLPDFPHGVWFVDLSPLTDPALVIPTIAQVLGVPEAAGPPLTERVQGYVRDKHLLLVLDNCEQVVEAGPQVSVLLQAAPGLQVLAYNEIILSARQTFSDVPPTSPFWVYIERVAVHGAISGDANGTFRPNNDVTRGQLAKIDAEVKGYNDIIPSTQQTFSDVAPDSTFWVYIERVALHGVMSGYADGTFRPNNNVTRGQAAKIVSNTFFPDAPRRCGGKLGPASSADRLPS